MPSNATHPTHSVYIRLQLLSWGDDILQKTNLNWCYNNNMVLRFLHWCQFFYDDKWIKLHNVKKGYDIWCKTWEIFCSLVSIESTTMGQDLDLLEVVFPDLSHPITIEWTDMDMVHTGIIRCCSYHKPYSNAPGNMNEYIVSLF